MEIARVMQQNTTTDYFSIWHRWKLNVFYNSIPILTSWHIWKLHVLCNSIPILTSWHGCKLHVLCNIYQYWPARTVGNCMSYTTAYQYWPTGTDRKCMSYETAYKYWPAAKDGNCFLFNPFTAPSLYILTLYQYWHRWKVHVLCNSIPILTNWYKQKMPVLWKAYKYWHDQLVKTEIASSLTPSLPQPVKKK